MKYLYALLILWLGLSTIQVFSGGNLGGIRGGPRTGFEVVDGDSITIGTSTPDHEFEIYNTATGTLKIYGSPACSIWEDTDSAGFTYCTYLNGTETCSDSDICN